MGFLDKLLGRKSASKGTAAAGYTCSVCGKTGQPFLQAAAGGAQVAVARPDQMRKRILKCSKCGRYVCGACAGGTGMLVCPTCKEPCTYCDWTPRG